MASKSKTPYTSKGMGRNVNKDTLKAMRRSRTFITRKLAQMVAHKAGKKTLLTDDETKHMGPYKMKITPFP